MATATFKTETCRFLRLERPSDEARALGALAAPGTMHLVVVTGFRTRC